MGDFLKLLLPDGNFIAYHKREGKKKASPGIIFLGGFRSDMSGAKAIALEEFTSQNDLDFIRFDYFGHGISSGIFEQGGTIGRWKSDVLAILDNLTDRPQILVGSSMGGWLMLLAALARPKKIAGLLGIAAAPDFTEYLIWDKFTDAEKSELTEKKIVHIPSDECGTYPITLELIEEARNHLLLNVNPVMRGQEARASHELAKLRAMENLGKFSGRIKINIPIRLIHGMADADVPYQTSVQLAEIIESKDIRVILQKSGGHRMSEPEDLDLITRTLGELILQTK